MLDTNVPVKLRFFDLKSTFDRRLADGLIDNGDICFTKDTGEIFVFDGVFGGAKGGLGPGFDMEEKIGYVSRISQTDGVVDADVVQSIPASDVSINIIDNNTTYNTNVEDVINKISVAYQ